MQKLKNNEPRPEFNGSYKKRVVFSLKKYQLFVAVFIQACARYLPERHSQGSGGVIFTTL